MDFSEFLRRLGAEPNDQDPEFLQARHSGAEFEQAAANAEAFERKLQRAAHLPAPEGLQDQILTISSASRPRRDPRWRYLAIAAGLLLAVGAAGITWKFDHRWGSVDEYVMDHYRHDGKALLLHPGEVSAQDIQEVFAEFKMTAAPGLADIISVIKYCPTPDGTGIHMVLNTSGGLVTVIYMPETGVTDREHMAFDDVNALYVAMEHGSAIIISAQPDVDSLYALVQQSIVPSRG